ncbi:AraC family transcriptional regulator, partial [Nostoc sp. LPT]
QNIKIYWNADLLSSFQSSFDQLPALLKQLKENPMKQRFHQPLGVTTPTMQLLLRQILQCPFQETLRQMYLEAKVLELLVLQIAQWGENNQVLQRSLFFRPDEIERLHHAKAILNQTLPHPPSLLDLANQVGLNDFKLKRGFREVFGTTVLGYVLSLRLEQAKQLLINTNLTIAEIAYQVGYESSSHFGYLFKRQLGMTPRNYRKYKGL